MVSWLKWKLVSPVNGSTARIQEQLEKTQGMPSSLPSHLLKDARLFADRYDLIGSILPNIKGGTFCEVGVALGNLSSFLIENGHPDVFYSIDTFTLDQLDELWGRPANEALDGKSHYQYYADKIAAAAEHHGTEFHLYQGAGSDLLFNVPDRSCDLVYIGSDYSYDTVLNNTIEAFRILKEGGIIVFNNYTKFDVIGNQPYGVVDAANNFISQNGLKILGLSLEQDMFCNLAVQFEIGASDFKMGLKSREENATELRLRVMDFIRNDERYHFFYDAVTYVNYEDIPGDVLDLGVYGGRTTTILGKYLAESIYKKRDRHVIGFDSFEGLAADMENHAVWAEGDCAFNNDMTHPILDVGEPVSPESVQELSKALGLPEPEIVVGWFANTLAKRLETVVAAAIIHVDCDLYEAAKDIFDVIEPVLQPGTLIAFDDWFHYRGDPNKGEARAFHEFLEAHPHWGAVQYKTYGTFSNSFILYRKP